MAVVGFFFFLLLVSAILSTAHLDTEALETKGVRGKLWKKVLDETWYIHAAVSSLSWGFAWQG